MKTSIKTIIFAAAAIFAAVSCQKESAVSESQAGETIQVNITASIGDLTATDATKAAAEQVVRIKWEEGDIVQAYCGTTKISGEAGLTVTPSENGMFASLTGTITPPNNGQTITFVYSNGCAVSDENPLDFDFFFQKKEQGIPFVAYATFEYEGGDSIEGKMVGFRLATSVMKITATNLGGGSTSIARISGVKTKITLVPSESGDPAINASEPANISTDNVDASSDGTRAIITVGLVPDSNKARSIAVEQTEYTNKGALTPIEIEGNGSYTTPTSLFPCGKLGPDDASHDYVLIAGTKWATKNLAISTSGQRAWSGTYEEPFILPCLDSYAPIGDFFQWGAHNNYAKIKETEAYNDHGLLLYFSFDHNCTRTKQEYFYPPVLHFKDIEYPSVYYQYHKGTIAPYYDNGSYTKYSSIDNNTFTLEQQDDVATICWGDSWRMPTSNEFEALIAATYWKYDANDQGYYVYAPQSGDAGKKDGKGSGSYDKEGALLFFPLPGICESTTMTGYGTTNTCGKYWTSNVRDDYSLAECLSLSTKDGVWIHREDRAFGCSVRPVSE